jgi:hypothetical protein
VITTMNDKDNDEKLNGMAQLRAAVEVVKRNPPKIKQASNASMSAISENTSDIKNPEGDLLNPASMPADQQGDARAKTQHHDLEGQQAGTNGGGHEVI